MKWIWLVLWKLQRDAILSTDRRTDGQTDDVKPVYHPFNFVEAGGIKMYNILTISIVMSAPNHLQYMGQGQN